MDAPGRIVLDALGRAPAGPELLAAAAGLPGVHLVGGAVRDLLLGSTPRELDVVVDGDPAPLLARLSAGAPGPATVHPRFATATVTVPAGRIDVARSRRERYPIPGGLPEVEPAPLTDDLLRRDFTVNAIAVSLDAGELRAAPGALGDLDARRLRVLHDRSFVEDPTRLLRLARYRARLGFLVEPHTAGLAAAASLDGVSGARVGAELRLALLEPDPLAALDGVRGLPVKIDAPVARRATQLLPADGRVDLMILGILTRQVATEAWLESLGLTARDRDVVRAVWGADRLAGAMAGAPSALHAALAREPVEAVAAAGALGPGEAARRWLEELRHVRLEIGGEDLVGAGIPPGPDIGRRLARTLGRKLDGELAAGRAAELESALG
jgi:tRNA nucleotidyltransferase (CCA-adding enzyme)